MKIAFFSNYLTHHQIPFCEEMRKLPGVEFAFISTMEMEADRKSGGWALEKEYDYELKAWLSEENHRKALALAAECDVMLIGSAPEAYVKHRMASHPKPLTFRYSERLYKGGRWRVLSPRGAIKRLQTFFRYMGKPLYMLCASAYTAGDLAMLGSYLGRCYKWGYFPEVKEYANTLPQKAENTLLWAGRLLDWKHPEAAVEVARLLKEEGYDFHLNLIGTGPMEETLRTLIAEYQLTEKVSLLGTMTPEQVRQYMEKSRVYLFTSDQKEGWGAVLNESMNSGCAVVADSRIGSVPFLIENGKNGFSYVGTEQLYQRVKQLLDEPELCEQLGNAAYTTITEKWCAKEAAKRLYKLSEHLLEGKMTFEADGPCSKAPIFLKKRR